jgi:hypothetical protein
MAEPLTAAAIVSVVITALKEVGKTIFQQAKKTLLTF